MTHTPQTKAALSFEQFQATRWQISPADFYELDLMPSSDQGGYLYGSTTGPGVLVIEKASPSALFAYYLDLGSEEHYSDDLSELENKLYAYALEAGHPALEVL